MHVDRNWEHRNWVEVVDAEETDRCVVVVQKVGAMGVEMEMWVMKYLLGGKSVGMAMETASLRGENNSLLSSSAAAGSGSASNQLLRTDV